MPENFPRIEFRPTRDLRRKLEEFRRAQSKKLNRRVRMSELLNAILEDFFEKTRFSPGK